jgi:hypothetical protein
MLVKAESPYLPSEKFRSPRPSAKLLDEGLSVLKNDEAEVW